jgi:GTP cyclohydrolase I
VAVVLEARHLCMEMRGVRRSGVVETRVVRGAMTEPRFADALRALRSSS